MNEARTPFHSWQMNPFYSRCCHSEYWGICVQGSLLGFLLHLPGTLNNNRAPVIAYKDSAPFHSWQINQFYSLARVLSFRILGCLGAGLFFTPGYLFFSTCCVLIKSDLKLTQCPKPNGSKKKLWANEAWNLHHWQVILHVYCQKYNIVILCFIPKGKTD